MGKKKRENPWEDTDYAIRNPGNRGKKVATTVIKYVHSKVRGDLRQPE